MKVIVDANIIFSGILNSKSKIGDLLINSSGLIDFIAPDFLRTEIRNHYQRLSNISKLPLTQLVEVEFLICKNVTFLSEELVVAENWKIAYELVKDIDEKDTQYIAFSKQFNRKVWSGDKQLIRGLQRKGFNRFITTDQLFLFREDLKTRRRSRKRK